MGTIIAAGSEEVNRTEEVEIHQEAATGEAPNPFAPKADLAYTKLAYTKASPPRKGEKA